LDGKSIISVDQIREIKQDVYIVPNDSMQKAYVVRDADTMNANAQNAFLKILEEPPKHAVFILCTENPTALFPTVRSRCIELKAKPGSNFSDDDIDLEETEQLVSDFINALTGDNVKLMDCMFRIDKLDKLAFHSFLNISRESIINEIRKSGNANKAGLCQSLGEADSVLQKAGEMLDLNVSSGNIAGFICASMITTCN